MLIQVHIILEAFYSCLSIPLVKPYMFLSVHPSLSMCVEGILMKCFNCLSLSGNDPYQEFIMYSYMIHVHIVRLCIQKVSYVNGQ